MARHRHTTRPPVRPSQPSPIKPDPLLQLVEQQQALIAKMSQQLNDLEKRIADGDKAIPDAVKAQFDQNDPRFWKDAEASVRSAKEQMMADMVDWIPTRTCSKQNCNPVIIEGVAFEFEQGVPTRVPRAVVEAVEQSDVMYAEAETRRRALYASMQKQNAIPRESLSEE